MSFLEAIADKRKMYIDGIDANEGDINIDDIFGDFYPDKAHFIFELLQNAEDAEATEAIFTVTQEDCAFEHNGKRRFTEKDVRSITGIHNSTKSKSPDRIGKFGIGFKSVFVYTLTPSVYSGQFAFQILRQVVPEQLAIDPNLGDKTRFVLPFNNLKNPARVAYEEIKAGLEELAETTLLFLSGINSIRWQIDQQPTGEVLRIKHSEHHIEVQKRVGGKTTSSSHFLSFSDAVDLDKRCVAIAYELDLHSVTAFDAKKPLNEQLKIIPANPGRVAVFFPAEKETSGLRFHLHAPFVTVPDRSSIKDTPVNEPLFGQLARLAASSLHTVRDLKLLTADFLGVLPNSRCTIPKQYQPICEAIITEMNDKPLTPTHAKKHEPARHLLHAKKSFKTLLSEEDLKFLVDYDEEPFKWAIGAQQKNSDVDNFLSKLAITEWDIEAFVKMLEEKTSETPRVPCKDSKHANITGTDFMDWLANKSEEWHQELYALLNREFIIGAEYRQRHAIDRLKRLKIIRLSNGGYSTGSKCYFPSDGTEHDEFLPRVAIGVYSSGKNEVEQVDARNLLEKLGVREVGEAEQVETILKQRYTAKSLNPDINDLDRFITLVEKEPVRAQLFAGYCIFKSTSGKWVQPSQVFLDAPFLDTGLIAYYDTQGDNARRVALDLSYKDCGIPLEKIVKFAKAVGARTQLEITEVNCSDNPQYEYLRSVGGNRTDTGINRDYTITDLEKILKDPSLPISRLIWKTMCALPGYPNYLKAIYQNNQSRGHRHVDSQLVHHLKNAAWVPQPNNTFVIPSKAASELLPEGFPFDAGQAWIKAVLFGKEVLQMSVEQETKEAVIRELGFSDLNSLKEAQWFVGLTEEERQQFKDEHQSRQLPDQEPTNPKRRSRKVGEQAAVAPKRQTKEVTGPVPVGLEGVKEAAKQYLRDQYTNNDDPMICQVCQTPLPFKLDGGNYYFEKVEFLPELKRLHYQNYLALCPNHAAMFQHANGSRDKLKDMFVEMDSNKLEVVLAQKDTTIYFTKTHIADLKAVIKADQQENEPDVQS